MSYRSKHSNDDGFTLVEVLVTLALTTIIATFILGGLGIAKRAWIIAANDGRTDELEAGASRLRDLLSLAVPALTIDGNARIAHPQFNGTSNTLTFVTLSEGRALEGGLIRIQLSWDRANRPAPNTQPPVVLRTAVFRSKSREVIDREPAILFQTASRFSLKYFGNSLSSETASWHSEWQGRDRLPQLVLAEIDIEDSGVKHHMSLPIRILHGQPGEVP